MTKSELIEAATKMTFDRGALPKLRAQQRNAQGANPGALEEWCPPSPARVAKKRARALPATRAACDMLMDGDRLAEHITRCGECQVQGARLQVSNDGANWTNYTGAVENVEAYAHVRCVATVTTPWIDLKSTLSPKSADFFGIDRTVAPKLAPDFLKMHLALCRSNRGGDCNCFGLLTNDVPPPKLVINLECQGCGVGEGVQHHPRCPRLVPICAGVKSFPCFGARALRHTVKGKPPAMLCDGHYLHVESTLIEGPRMQTALSDPKVPERLDHRRPPMAHSFGVEDPALPNA